MLAQGRGMDGGGMDGGGWLRTAGDGGERLGTARVISHDTIIIGSEGYNSYFG